MPLVVEEPMEPVESEKPAEPVEPVEPVVSEKPVEAVEPEKTEKPEPKKRPQRGGRKKDPNTTKWDEPASPCSGCGKVLKRHTKAFSHVCPAEKEKKAAEEKRESEEAMEARIRERLMQEMNPERQYRAMLQQQAQNKLEKRRALFSFLR